jgi:hypothetical protein
MNSGPTLSVVRLVTTCEDFNVSSAGAAGLLLRRFPDLRPCWFEQQKSKLAAVAQASLRQDDICSFGAASFLD